MFEISEYYPLRFLIGSSVVDAEALEPLNSFVLKIIEW